MLSTGDVIWVFDRTTNPPKSKMMVCLSFDDGWFLRINTNKFRPAVAVDKTRNPWLDHDSHVECNLLILDEFLVEESLRDQPDPLGKLHRDHFGAIVKAIMGLRFVRFADKQRIAELMR